MTLSVLGQQDVGRKRRWARQNKMLEKAKKNHWVPYPPIGLGDKEVGNQDVGQPRQWATKMFDNDKTCLGKKQVGQQVGLISIEARHHHDKLSHTSKFILHVP